MLNKLSLINSPTSISMGIYNFKRRSNVPLVEYSSDWISFKVISSATLKILPGLHRI